MWWTYQWGEVGIDLVGGGDTGYDVIITGISRARACTHLIRNIKFLTLPNMESVDFDDANINVQFVDALFILLDELCVLRVFC